MNKPVWQITISPRAGGVRVRTVSPSNARLVDLLAERLERAVTEFLIEAGRLTA